MQYSIVQRLVAGAYRSVHSTSAPVPEFVQHAARTDTGFGGISR